MIPEIGHFALILALALALVQAIFPLIGSFTGSRAWMDMARPLAWGQFTFALIAFAALTQAFLTNDFSVAYVARNSNSLMPDVYKVSAVWGAHEGSLLLWAMLLSAWGAAVASFSRNLPLDMISRVLSVQGMIAIGFLLFMLLTSNPFERIFPVPLEGRDLNPLLQDFGLAIHPPMLYMGYVGFSVAFAFAIAALIGGRLDAAWARWSRPWTTVAWIFLTIGIALGVLVGLLRVGLGRLVVLGPGGERLPHALAGGHGPDPFARSDGEARGLQVLDRAAGHLGLFAQPARDLPGALRGPDLGPRLRHGPDPRHLHPDLPVRGHRRLAGPLRHSRPQRLQRRAASIWSPGRASCSPTTCC